MHTNYIIDVTYGGEHYPQLDQKLNDIFGRYSDESGMGFGERDLAWFFKTRRTAQKYFDKLSRMKKLSQISLKIVRT